MFDPKNIPIHEKNREAPESSLHVPGAKDDSAKVDLSIILECFPRALWEVGRVADYGARKYSRGGCLQVNNAMQRYEAADMRHKLKRHQGEARDPESGELHLAHEAWNALIKLELYLREKKDEPKKGA